MNALVDSQCRPLNELFMTTRMITNMGSDTAVDSFYKIMLTIEQRKLLNIFYHVLQDHFF